MASTETSRFHLLCLTTLVAVYVLIGVGGIVRATGSGMGCPDWPKCFGAWMPPSRVDELPANYKEIYSGIRVKKNARFAEYLERLGFNDLSARIRNDKSILEEADFNPAKTWTEYINRILGVIIGMLIMLTAAYSLRYRKVNPPWFLGSVICLVTVIVQGWLGSVVVSTNLTPWVVTIHMLPALFIIAILTFLVVRTRSHPVLMADKGLRWLVLSSAAVLLVQIIMGTQVREAIDRASAVMGESLRSAWLDSVGFEFIVHRSFSWIPGLMGVAILVALRRQNAMAHGRIVLILLALSLVTGAGMAYAGIPPFLQPLHLLIACACFGSLVALYFRMSKISGKVV